MSPVTLANLAAWWAQTALIVGAGLTTLWLVRLEAPAIRYLFLRALLAICLTLPLVQPRMAVQAAVERSTGSVAIAVNPGPPRVATSTTPAHWLMSWPSVIAAVILVATVVAALSPLRTAARIDPAEALRSE